jgi:hypothetical protein
MPKILVRRQNPNRPASSARATGRLTDRFPQQIIYSFHLREHPFHTIMKASARPEKTEDP